MLGPLLFLIYIDWVAWSVPHSNITIYVDDIAVYEIISNPNSQKFHYVIFTTTYLSKLIIEASLSEPHTSELNGVVSYM